MVAAGGDKAVQLAGELGDGLISTGPDAALVRKFREAGGEGKPLFGQVTVCWAPSEEEAVRRARALWPIAALPGELTQELPMPAHFEQASQLVREEDIRKSVVCGPDPERHIEMLNKYIDAGFDHVYVHQIGPEQEAAIRFYREEIMPALELESMGKVPVTV
jgi:G6PDH family F420-dependent oxidoreductase